ncbi:hypothetical protein GGI35DRAFT_78528 [Trichoderma velutinum]
MTEGPWSFCRRIKAQNPAAPILGEMELVLSPLSASAERLRYAEAGERRISHRAHCGPRSVFLAIHACNVYVGMLPGVGGLYACMHGRSTSVLAPTLGGEVGDALSRHLCLSVSLISIAFSRYLRHPACLDVSTSTVPKTSP